MGVADTKRAIEAADVAFKTWSKTTAEVCLFEAFKFCVDLLDCKARHNILKKLFDLTCENMDDLARIIASPSSSHSMILV